MSNECKCPIEALASVADPKHSTTQRVGYAREALNRTTAVIIATRPSDLVAESVPIFWRTSGVIRELLSMVHSRGAADDAKWRVNAAIALAPILTMIIGFIGQHSPASNNMVAGVRVLGSAFGRAALIMADTDGELTHSKVERVLLAEAAAKFSATLYATAAYHLPSTASPR